MTNLFICKYTAIELQGKQTIRIAEEKQSTAQNSKRE